ncbi:TetR/AcrR family transcriptional regulator [Streptomyces sp. NA02950]|uniref:TetR/AcrR family transcriptional regulator n=1 Tax=Streptomyces sp. NA02950 TaxID=2742137 RepID=UPI0015912FCB|nr:TetR/AcrR family transcriptional regulator [Streptomyces sp. NA02950]QKV95371.1 TetR/AcrR family transcriptional regulator [Streptomyces sp. NA02950]
MATARRERYRKQTREEAKAVALAQLAEAGTSGISLNAIAKSMGMTGPALYRYFAGRDELLTELITDAYRDLAEAAAAAVADAAPDDRFRALAHAIRDWAKAQPDRYLLIYGTPVPGYQAPPETTEIARALMRTIFDACAGLGGTAADEPASPLEAELARRLEAVGPWADGADPDGGLKGRALRTWTRLHGVISLDVQGQFSGMGFDPGMLFEAEVEALARGV